MRWGVLLWAVAVGHGYAGAVGGGAEDIGKNYVLLIRFDSNDRVERFGTTKRSNFDSYGEHLETWLKKTEEPQPAAPQQQSDEN